MLWCPECVAGLAGAAGVGVDGEDGSADGVAAGVLGLDGLLSAGWAGCGDVFGSFGVEEVLDGVAPVVDGAGDGGDVVGVLGSPGLVVEGVESLGGGAWFG